jgi:hypothetical protein
LIELMISSTLVVLIFGAVAAITAAVAQTWHATDNMQSVQVTAYQAPLQIYKLVRSSNYVGVATADDPSTGAGAAIMFWTDASGDGRIQASEVTVIEHNLSDNTLKLYQLPSTAANASTRFYTSDISTTAAIKSFETTKNVTCQVMARNVTAASFKSFYANSTASRQSVDLQLTFTQDTQTRGEFCTATLRCPIQPIDT